eukprot:GEMP01042920.1.p1 GENE.GEMP01042920.1~~GEMP01042920.1.p1  ORF type:complete len:355 (+),score=63.62 GEMP01042920.1:104-1066(+)
MKNVVMHWAVLSVASLFWFILAIVSAANASRAALPVFCVLNALFLGFAALGLTLIAWRHKQGYSAEHMVEQQGEMQGVGVDRVIVDASPDARRTPTSSLTNAGLFVWPSLDLGQKLLLTSALVFYVILAIRLFSAQHFGGSVADFDFGIKPSGSRNLSFTPEWASCGHCLQGMSSVFLFPAFISLCVRYLCACVGEQGKEKASSVLYVVPIIMVVYPTYNLIKRVIKYRDQFAISSFANNGAEWASGAMLGICIGLCTTVLAANLGMLRDGEQKSEPVVSPISTARRTMKICTIVAGAIVNLSAVCCLAFFIASWNNTAV